MRRWALAEDSNPDLETEGQFLAKKVLLRIKMPDSGEKGTLSLHVRWVPRISKE